MDYSMESLLAYDPDEERRRKATEDLKAAADKGRQETQGSSYLGMMGRGLGSALGDAASGLADLEFGNYGQGAQKQIATPQPRPPAPPPGMMPGHYGDTRMNDQNTEGLDRIEAQYKQSTEHPDLGFSWGGAPTQAYRPGSDIRSGQYGSAPTEDSSRRDPYSGLSSSQSFTDRQSTGGGGLTMQPLDNNSSFEDWRSRVANPGMFSGAMEALEMPGIEAGLSRDRALKEDPFLLEGYQSRQKIAERQAPEQAKAAQSQEYFQNAMRISQERKAELDKLHKNPAFSRLDPQKQMAAEQDVNSQFDDQEDALDFAFHGRTRRKQGLGL